MNTRKELEEDWIYLYKYLLPSYAVQSNWPITKDHCFARIILDNIHQAKWSTKTKKPAYKNMTDEELEKAIFLAQTIIRKPRIIYKLNQLSLAYREKKLK
jgi:hypothetical protein